MVTFIYSEKKKNRIRACKGFALVTVLMLSSLLMILLVGLLLMTSEEGDRSVSYLGGERARSYVGIAFAEVQAKIMDGGEIPYKDGVAKASMTACPGLMEVRRYDGLPNRGYQEGREAFTDPQSFFRKPFATTYERKKQGDWQPANPQWIALYSQKWYAPSCQYMTAEGALGKEGGSKLRDLNPDYNPERVFNINTADNPFTPGKLYLGGVSGKSVGVRSVSLDGEYADKNSKKEYRYRAGETSVERPVYVQWIPFYKDPRYGATLPNGDPNPIEGRYAYWVDVENTKINLKSIKREWQQTLLGQATGVSNAERGMGDRSYFRQSGEEERDTIRYRAESNKLTTYKLFRDNISSDYGVALFYRPNYVRRGGGGGYVTENYEKGVFGWEGGLPPAIADNSTIDQKFFSGLRPYGKESDATAWLEQADLVGDYNLLEEMYAVLDPKVERKKEERGQVALVGLEKMYGRAFTSYGWEEERDPLGRPKLDINAILREGDELFDRGQGLPKANHQGTPLQQFLARLDDPDYYHAYYLGAYPTKGKSLSFTDSFKPFAGKGVDADRYARAMRDQLVTNIVEYGRNPRELPYVDEKRGIIGAKSMPYVAEVAIRCRSALWDLWDRYDPTDYDPTQVGEHDPYDLNNKFPGPYEHELTYNDNYRDSLELADEDLYLVQKIYDMIVRSASDYKFPEDEEGESNGPVGRIAGTGGVNGSGGIFSYAGQVEPVEPQEPAGETPGQQAGSIHDILGRFSSVFMSRSGGNQVLDIDRSLKEVLTHVVIDIAFALVNPDPFARNNASDWELEVAYSWADPKSSVGKSWGILYGAGEGGLRANREFSGTNREEKIVARLNMYNKSYCPYLLPQRKRQIDQLGYVYSAEGSQAHYWVYFKPGTGLLPGITVDGGAIDAEENLFGIPSAFQSLRLWGWKIKRSRSSRYHHKVPLRHPGQEGSPRKFWEMTVDRDGNGPEPPPKCGVLASTESSDFGLSGRKFRYADLHSLEHFRHPGKSPVQNIQGAAFREGNSAVPFELGLRETESWKTLKERKNVATSWFSSQTIFEFEKHCESLMATIPPSPGKRLVVRDKVALDGGGPPRRAIVAPVDPTYFYHFEQELERQGLPPLSGLEGKLYIPVRASKILENWVAQEEDPNGERRIAARSDLLRFLLLQVKLRDEAKHHERIVSKTGRSQASTGRNGDDAFVEGAAMVERVICIDPVLGHRTGDGNFYGITGHPWRRYNYFFHHYDKDRNSPQTEVLGMNNARPEPDQCLTWHFRDPRRCNGSTEYEPANYYADSEGAYGGYTRRRIPLVGITGSVLWNAVLTKGGGLPDLRGERGRMWVNDVEEEDVKVWPYGPGMDASYGYHKRSSAHDRMYFRQGSFMTHASRGQLMHSIGEIGLCHSGFIQRAIDLDRPPIYVAPGVKRLGSPQYGPPMNMLLDLLTPSNYQDEGGYYLKREDWEKGDYRVHSPRHPRVGTWNVNSSIAHDNYLAIREGAHGELVNKVETFFASDLDKVAVHPVLVPNAIGKRKRSREIVDGSYTIDPYLSPLVHFRRGWEHWLGVIAGDYSEHRNMGGGTWNKGEESRKSREVYAIARGVKSFSWHSGGARLGSSKKSGSVVSYINFSDRKGIRGNLFALGKEPSADSKGKTDWSGLGGHVSADGPVFKKGEKNRDQVSLYDVTRYGLFPMVHHISELGYTGLGRIYTALNHRSGTTPAHGGGEFEEKLVDEGVGGDGILGAMSQAGFARNAPWVMSANQASTSANVFTVHIVTQSLKEKADLSDRRRGEMEEGREKRQKVKSRKGKSTASGMGYMDKRDAIMGEQWAQIVVARIPRTDIRGTILTDKEGAPQYEYRVLSKKVLAQER